MDNTQNEITFSQLFAVLKKSIVRAAIYAAIFCVVVLAALMITKQFTKSASYDAVVEYEASDFASDELFKKNKNDIVKKAVGSVLSGRDDIDTVSAQISAMTSISALDADTEAETSEYPSTYLVSLNSNNSLDLSDNQYKNILDEIVKEFKAKLDEHNKRVIDEETDVFFTIKISDYDIAEALKNQQTVQVANTLTLRVESLSEAIRTSLNAISSNKMHQDEKAEESLELLLNELAVLSNRIENVEIYILNNGVGDIESLNAYLELAKKEAKINSDTYKEIYEINLKLAENFPLSPFYPTQNEGNNYSTQDYAILIEKVNDALARKAAADRKIALYDSVVVPTTGNMTNAELIKGQVSEFGSHLSSVLAKYNQIIEEYNEERYNESAAVIASYAQGTAYNPISTSIILLSLIAVVFVTFAVAYVQTYRTMKKKGLLTAQKSE